MFDRIGSNGSFAYLNVAASVIEVTLDVEIPADCTALVRAVSHAQTNAGAAGTASGASNNHDTLTDNSGLGITWTKVAEVTQGYVITTRPGTTVSLWRADPTVAIPLGTKLTVSLADPRTGRAIDVTTYDKGGTGYTATLVDVAIANDRNASSAIPMAVTLTLPDSAEHNWVGAAGVDGLPDYVPTIPAFWQEDVPPIGQGFTTGNGNNLFGQYRTFEAGTMTWQPDAATTRGWALILAAFLVEPPAEPPPPPGEEGTRQYESEFETPTYGLLRASTTRRPDAVSLDYLTALAEGPVDIGDMSQGYNVRSWYVRVDGALVWICRGNAANNTWEPERPLFSYAPPLIEEMDFCFDSLGHPVIVAERPTGSMGAPEVWVFRKV